ncbi:MAG TPA: phosphate acyltransferase PlsX [Planctomycetota bacterium]|nr:phosphate acyltransferase PlsX [Planctomycetota bacterium]
MRIAIDAMGGDHAPDEIVRGAVEEAPKVPEATLILVGQPDRVEKALAAAGSRPPNIQIQPASEVIEMHEDPRRALIRKRDSSIHIGLGLVKHAKADAFICAGNTGALVGGATVPMFGLGCLEGVKRPAIAVPMPTQNGFAALVDAGANKEAKAIHLLQWAVMGSVYIKYLRKDVIEPKVGLLNIGEERNKGTALLQEAYPILEKSHLKFIGNIEPHKIFSGAADVIVCDGFTGNVFLKTSEGFSNFLLGMIRSNGLADSQDIRAGVSKIEQRMDYSSVGGAPLLGVRGVVLKCHGRSKSRAIVNAVRVAAGFIRDRLNDHIVEELKSEGHVGWFSGWWKSREEPAVE